MTITINSKAPEVLFKTSETKTIKLSDLHGKNLVLYFYPKDDTPGCTIEAQEFTKLREGFDKLNTVIIGISKDDLKSHGKFQEKYCISFYLASDDSGIAEKYGVWVEKSMYGKKYMGIERTSFLIDKHGNIAHIWNKVKPEGHAVEVLNFIKDQL
jgi:thioredoxin-dependent peroxiredoxin